MLDLIESDWYKSLLDELTAILSETRFSVNTEIIKGKWEVGRRIWEDHLHFQRGRYGQKVVKMLAKDLDISYSGLWKCVQFYKKFPLKEFDKVLLKLETDSKTPTWHLVCQKILPISRSGVIEDCEHRNLLCLKCRKRFNNEELMPKE